MDFTLSDHQQAISDLADAILGDRCPPEALRELEREAEAGTPPLAADAWRALAEADLLGLAVPAHAGGSGLGVVEAALVAEQVGRHVALVPYWPTVAAAATLARWGSPDQHRRWLPGAVDGTGPLAVALWEPGTPGAATARPTVTATPTAGNGDGRAGWRLDGVKQPVPWGRSAAAVLVPTALEDGGEADVALFAVPPDTPGVTIAEERVVSREPYQTFVFDGARVGPEALVAQGPEGAEAASWLAGRAAALLCATALGVAEGALALTASHVTERRQFGAPIGTFQAVAQRSADAYIDTEAIRLTTWQAAWRLDAGLPADDELTIAAFWVAEGGQRVVHAAQHLHGGIGVDIDYPVHRYFRWAKVLELLLGGASGSLVRLGASLAAGGPTTS